MCNRLHASNGCSGVISAVRIRPSADIGADLSLCRRHNGNAKRTHWGSSSQTLRPCSVDFVPLKEHRPPLGGHCRRPESTNRVPSTATSTDEIWNDRVSGSSWQIAGIPGRFGERVKSTQSGRSRGALRSAGFVPFADLQLIPWTGDLGEELSFPIDFFQIPAGFVRESQAGSTT
jgi:hypothetical protein